MRKTVVKGVTADTANAKKCTRHGFCIRFLCVGFVIILVGHQIKLSFDANGFFQALSSMANEQPRVPTNTTEQSSSFFVVPFDPFTDFRFLVPPPPAQEDSYYSSHHCVGTGTQFSQPEWNTSGQSERGSYERRRPNFVNRHCHYRNLYFRVTDQTFHYFASSKESKLFKESRMMHGPTKEDAEALLERTYQEHHFERHPGNETNFLQKKNDRDEIKEEEGSAFSYSEHVDRMTVQIEMSIENENLPFKQWRPIIHEYDSSPTKTVSPELPPFAILDIHSNEHRGMNDTTEFYVSLYFPSFSYNVGHLLWDDILSVYSLHDRLIANDNRNDGSSPTPSNDFIIPFLVELPHLGEGKNYGGRDYRVRCSPWNNRIWNKCVVTYKRLFESLTGVRVDKCSGDVLRSGNWLRGDEAVGVWRGHRKDDSCIASPSFKTTTTAGKRRRERNKVFLENNPNEIEYVLIPNVLAGGGRLAEFGCDDSCMIGRGMELYRFRNYVFRNILATSKETEVVNENKEKAGYILFSIPSNSSRPNEVYYFENEIKEATLRYGDNVVRVVDLSEFSLADQARLLDETAVFVTNHGGGAMGATLLPLGSSVLSFWHGENRKDHALFESSVYFRTTWIGVEERSSTNRTMAIIDYEYHRTLLEWRS